MGKRKKSEEELELTPEAQELIEERLEEVREGKVITTEELRERLHPVPLSIQEPKRLEETMFKAGEWARQDPDHPDPLLFAWWDTQGVMPYDKYLSIKPKVFRKK